MKSKNIPLNERIIFALDVDSLEKCEEWLDLLGPHINFFKVGLELFIAEGFKAVDAVTKRGHKVMVDLKLFDVPETVGSAISVLKERNVSFATIHGNDPIIRAAVKVKSELKILAVTVLTSFDEDDMKELGLTGTVEDLVFQRAKKAILLGCDGIVSSGREAKRVRKELDNNFIIVTPGIRPGKNIEIAEDDQKRITTAQDAIINGADYVVVGRPIKMAKDPISVVKSMQQEIEKDLKAKANFS